MYISLLDTKLQREMHITSYIFSSYKNMHISLSDTKLQREMHITSYKFL